MSTVSNIDTAMPGTYSVTYIVEDSAGNTTSVIRTVVVADRTAPVVTLNGNMTDTVEKCHAYMDPGAMATDNYDTTVMVTMNSNLDTNTAGTYTIDYCAVDAAGNSATCATRTVVVVDTQAPVVSIMGPDTVNMEVMTNYNEPGLNIDDDCTPESEMTITTSGTWTGTANQLGCFSIIYTVTDPAGNSSQTSRTVCVSDNTAPDITLIGDPTMVILRWHPFIDPGVSVSDNFDSSPTVDTGGTFIDTQKPGVYFRSYQATDKSGNKSEIIDRIIIVDENTGIAESNLSGTVKIHPNPNSGQFVIEIELPQMENVRISILDMVGKEIKVVEDANITSAVYPIDVDKHESGVYFIKVESKGATSIHKVIVNK